jgi:hypothetical protein
MIPQKEEQAEMGMKVYFAGPRFLKGRPLLCTLKEVGVLIREEDIGYNTNDRGHAYHG